MHCPLATVNDVQLLMQFGTFEKFGLATEPQYSTFTLAGSPNFLAFVAAEVLRSCFSTSLPALRICSRSWPVARVEHTDSTNRAAATRWHGYSRERGRSNRKIAKLTRLERELK